LKQQALHITPTSTVYQVVMYLWENDEMLNYSKRKARDNVYLKGLLNIPLRNAINTVLFMEHAWV